VAARKQIDLKEVERLAGLGLTQEQIAISVGVSPRTLESRKAESAEFAAAIKKGQADAIQEVSNALFQNAKGGNVTAQIFFLKARAQWKDRHEDVGEDGEGPTPVKVEVTVRDGRKPDAD
jgi:DNA-binding XRE family transcriptional regulator